MDEWRSYPLDYEEQIRKKVGKYFSIYERKEGDVLAFYVDIPYDEEILEYRFEELRMELKKMNLIPILRREEGEYVLFIAEKPFLRTKPPWINLLLFFATIITTMLSGSILFLETWSWKELFAFHNLLNGLIFFSFPLLAILGVHEWGHYFVSKRHGVAASLPFFIPVPPNPFLPLGTLGAVISMREPIPDRKALIDIGIAGPLAGFLISIPVCLVGLFLMEQNPIEATGEGLAIHFPILLTALSEFFTFPSNIVIHPTAFAGWVGLLVTAINLLPAGQLDGGHIARGVLREKHKYASFIAVAFLLSISFIGGGSWMFMAFFIIFFIGMGHPPALNELVSLDAKRKLLALIALLIFIVSFTPIPISSQ
ncbi:MAG: site-2 protease family protein [Thermoplasmata archaeon]|nr:MAG: site-2 protease family protein [Thermoplasmata archaeon]